MAGLKKYGLDYDSLRALNPRLVYCSITGFGQNGPYAARAGYDFIIQGMSGLMSITGPAGGEPQKVGVAVTDIFTGLYSVIAIQAALRHAEATGQGQHIDMALFDAQIAVLANQNLNYLVSGKPPVQMGNAHPNIAPYEVLPVADGHIILAVGNDGQFRKFCAVVGLDDLRTPSRLRHERGPRRQPCRLARGDCRKALADLNARRCSHCSNRRACRQVRSTRSPTCSPTRRPMRAACGWSSRMGRATPCPPCARR